MRAASASPVTTPSAESTAAHMPATTSAVLREGGTRRESENSSRQSDRNQNFWCWHQARHVDTSQTVEGNPSGGLILHH
jgi:hypothetical protein